MYQTLLSVTSEFIVVLHIHMHVSRTSNTITTMSILYDQYKHGMNNNFSAMSCISNLSDSVSSKGGYSTC